jgi:hypothetical protein
MSALATANRGVLVTSNTGVPSILGSAATTGQLLQSNAAAAPSYSTSTYPATNAINTLLYASAANTMSALATANNGTLVTSSAGVPSILAGPGTTGKILQSNAAAAPSFSTATYPSTAGTSGNFLKSDGTNWSSSALPVFSVVVQTFTSSGTYTPTSGMKYCTIEVVGGGGGGAASNAPGASQCSTGGGGGGGGYARKTVTAATIGASQTVTIGTGGTAGTAGGGGGTGVTTSVGAIVSATGGVGGTGSGAGANTFPNGGNGGVGSSGDINSYGNAGGNGAGSATYSMGGPGGSSYFGGGSSTTKDNPGVVGNVYGGGGSGAGSSASQAGRDGGDGGKGVCIITEYVIV